MALESSHSSRLTGLCFKPSSVYPVQSLTTWSSSLSTESSSGCPALHQVVAAAPWIQVVIINVWLTISCFYNGWWLGFLSPRVLSGSAGEAKFAGLLSP